MRLKKITGYVSSLCLVAALIISCGSSTNGDNSNTVNLNAPSGLLAAAASSSQIDITWDDNSTDETGFKIERSADNSGQPGSWTEISITAENITSYTDTGLVPETKYHYRVRAFNGNGDSAYSDSSSATTQPVSTVVPSSPSGLEASAASSNAIDLSWTDNSDNEEGFRVERAPDVSGNPGTWAEIKITNINAVSYADSGLSASTKYHYRIRAYNSAGYSGYSSSVSATTGIAPAATQIIADHSVVDQYDKIPVFYKNKVKEMWISYAGESHSSGLRNGALILEWQDSSFAVSVIENGNPEAYTDANLRLSRATWGDVATSGSWIYNYGEEDWFGNATAISKTKLGLDYCNTTGPSLSVLGFGWCWDHSVYTVSSNITAYLSATQGYIDYCNTNGYSTKIIFTTGPVDGYSGVDAYNRYLSEQQIRNYVLADPSRILFDYADILSWNNSGVENQLTYNENKYHQIHSDNMLNISGAPADANDDHIGQVGAVRLSKAMWWMLARIAGWDGN